MGDETTSSQKIFDPTTHDFARVKQQPTFVDHTELITLFFGDHPKKLFIAAPPHFCKSTNLDMVRQFFEIKPNGFVEARVEDRHNFSTFKDTNIMKIDAHREALTKHFCAHPVLYADFSIVKLESYVGALKHILRVLLKAFERHEQLLLKNLKDGRKDFFEDLMEEMRMTYDKPLEYLLWRGVDPLCLLLSEAYGGKRVLKLIDGAYAVVTAALTSNLNESQIKAITMVMTYILSNITMGDKTQGVLLTDISYLDEVGNSNRIKVQPYKYLNDAVFPRCGRTIVKMYSLTDTDLDHLLRKLERNGLLKQKSRKSIKETIVRNYNGYYTSPGNIPVYSLWSVLWFLQSPESSANHADMPPIVHCYRRAFKSTLVGTNIVQLLAREAVTIRYMKDVNITQLINLRNVEKESLEHRNLLFSLLMDVGYLTSVYQGDAMFQVKIPNKEMERSFIAMISDYKIQLGKFDVALQQECASEVNNLVTTSSNYYLDDTLFKQHLKSLYYKLTTLCQHFDPDFLNEARLKALIVIIMEYSILRNMSLEGEEDRGGYIDILSGDRNNTCIWEVKINKDLADNKTSMWAMKEIHGDSETMKKGYIRAAEKTDNYLLIGLSVNHELKPSICIRTKRNVKGIFVSETEHNIPCFAHYYQGWYDLLKESYVEPPGNV